MKGKYIYGIISNNGNVDLPTKGFFRKNPYTISYNNLSAVVKDAPIKIYEASDGVLLSHNKVLDDIMKNHTVLPMRFGTVSRSEGEVKDLLKSAYSVLTTKLLKIRNKVEFDIEISIVNEQPIVKEILEKDKKIREFRDKLVSQGKNAQIQEKLLIGKMIADSVAKYKTEIIKDILVVLKPYCTQYKSLAGKNVLANLAFLVIKSRQNEFEAGIYKLGEKYGDRLKFKYTGPLAPYSFVELRFVIINFNTVDTARRELRLDEQATMKEIRDAYRELAKKYHPDKNPGDGFKEEEFKKIASSYRLLSEYCRRYPKNSYIFKPDEIDEFSVLVEEE